MYGKVLFYIISIFSEAVYIVPVKYPALHLTNFKFDKKDLLQAIDANLIKKYSNQDKYERPLNEFKFTNMSNASSICGHETDYSIFPCTKQNNFNVFKELKFSGKIESFFKTDSNLCLTLKEKDFKTHGFNLKLEECSFNYDQKFLVISADNDEIQVQQDSKSEVDKEIEKIIQHNYRLQKELETSESQLNNIKINKSVTETRYKFPTQDTLGHKISYSVKVPYTAQIQSQNIY